MYDFSEELSNFIENLIKKNPTIRSGNISINILEYLKKKNVNTHQAQIIYIQQARKWALQKFRAFQFVKLYESIKTY